CTIWWRQAFRYGPRRWCRRDRGIHLGTIHRYAKPLHRRLTDLFLLPHRDVESGGAVLVKLGVWPPKNISKTRHLNSTYQRLRVVAVVQVRPVRLSMSTQDANVNLFTLRLQNQLRFRS